MTEIRKYSPEERDVAYLKTLDLVTNALAKLEAFGFPFQQITLGTLVAVARFATRIAGERYAVDALEAARAEISTLGKTGEDRALH